MIIFDENIEEHWIEKCIPLNVPFISIRKQFSGISDREVIEIVKQENGLLITEDKDFGELVFSHGIENVSVLFLRYDQPNYEQIESEFLKIIADYILDPKHCFITLTKNKIRKRFL